MKILDELRYKVFLFLIFYILIILVSPFAGVMGQESPISNPFESRKVEDFNFVAAGDFGCGNMAKETVANMTKRDPELVIALGDLSYSKNADCWFDTVSPIDQYGKLKISFGEHDMHYQLALFNAYMKHFGLVKPFYSFNIQNVHFLAMATGKNRIIPYNTSSEQYKFVNEDLESAHNDRNIYWIIVYQFRPFYSSLSAHPGLDELQEAYHPLFEKYGVDLLLQAHNHNYQRTYPLAYNISSSSHPIVTDRETTNYDNTSGGTIFLTVGTGGENLQGFSAKAPFIVTQLQAYGFLNIDITDNGKKLTGTFFANSGENFKDRFTIKKVQ